MGGVTLNKDKVGKIRRKISDNTSMNFVVFTPEEDPMFSGHFWYNITLTDIEPNSANFSKARQVVPVNVKANPSPPRNPSKD